MKTITFLADDALIEQARRQAMLENTTLDEMFRTWLERYVAQPAAAESYAALMAEMAHVCAGRRFAHEEMNERR